MGQKSLRRQFKSAQPHPVRSPPSVRNVCMTSKADADWHRTMAAHLFNSTWTLIEKKRRTQEERDTMIHMAHASRYHWGVVGGPKDLAIGEGQSPHVYAVVRRRGRSRCSPAAPRPSLTSRAISAPRRTTGAPRTRL